MPLAEFHARLECLLALNAVRKGEAGVADLTARAEAVVSLGERLATPTAETYKAWGELCLCVGHLVRWRSAVLDAEIDADRHQRAARQWAHNILLRLVEGNPASTQIHAAAESVLAVAEPAAITAAISAVAGVPLQLPFIAERQMAVDPGRGLPDRPEPLKALAFVQFFLDGRPMGQIQEVRANLVHDLSVQLRLSAPVPADIELSPYVVEPEGVVEAPTFCLGAGDQTRNGVGRLLVRIAHDSLARPLEIAYGLQAINVPDDRVIELRGQGQNRLILRCVEDTHTWSGNDAIEEAVAVARTTARAVGLHDSETAAFLQLFGSTACLGADALASNAFRGNWSEEKFHAEVRRRLRQDPGIGSDLEDHPHSGGGVTDLSFRRVRLELKCDNRPLQVKEALEAYGQQLVQYVVGSDRRTGVLLVLCPVEPGTAPGALPNDLTCHLVSPPRGGSREVLLGVVLVRSNLPAPSSHSR